MTGIGVRGVSRRRQLADENRDPRLIFLEIAGAVALIVGGYPAGRAVFAVLPQHPGLNISPVYCSTTNIAARRPAGAAPTLIAEPSRLVATSSAVWRAAATVGVTPVPK